MHGLSELFDRTHHLPTTAENQACFMNNISAALKVACTDYSIARAMLFHHWS
jgi:hypothetical protein